MRGARHYPHNYNAHKQHLSPIHTVQHEDNRKYLPKGLEHL